MGTEDNASANTRNNPGQNGGQHLVANSNRYLRHQEGKGEDRHAKETIKDKSPADLHPAHDEKRDVENQVEPSHIDSPVEIVNHKGHPCDPSTQKVLWNQDAIDGYCADEASQRYEKAVPGNGFGLF